MLRQQHLVALGCKMDCLLLQLVLDMDGMEVLMMREREVQQKASLT
jgi:hypothetical protein